MAGEGGARAAAAAGAAAAAAAAADSSDDDASREMNVNDVQIDPKLSIDGSPMAAAVAVAAAAVSPKRDIASVAGPTSNEPPTKKVAAADFDAATDDDKPDTSNDEAIAIAMQQAAPASAVPGGTINDMPKCDPTFAARVNLDPVPSIKPLPKLSHRDIAELELVSSTLAPSVVS